MTLPCFNPIRRKPTDRKTAGFFTQLKILLEKWFR